LAKDPKGDLQLRGAGIVQKEIDEERGAEEGQPGELHRQRGVGGGAEQPAPCSGHGDFRIGLMQSNGGGMGSWHVY
jgi:hypothetical protein